MKKNILFLSLLTIIFGYSSCSNENEENNHSLLGILEGTVWMDSYSDVFPDYMIPGDFVDDRALSDFIHFVNYTGLKCENLPNKVVTLNDTTVACYTTTNTLRFEKNACFWNAEKSTGRKVTIRNYTYDCYYFAPQEVVYHDIPFDAIDTIVVTKDAIWCWPDKKNNQERFVRTRLDNGIIKFCIDVSKEEISLPEERDVSQTKNTIFPNIRVTESSFLMQKGDTIYSAQYDVIAGWLKLDMLSPKKEEVGEFKLKKI